MSLRVRACSLASSVAVVSVTAGARVVGQTNACRTGYSIAPTVIVDSGREGETRRAEKVLQVWSSDFLPTPPVLWDSIDTQLAGELQDALGPRLASTLLIIMARPISASPFRVTPLQYGAAHFYVRAGFPDSVLENLLQSPDYELENRITVYRALQSRDVLEHRLSAARERFVCAVAKEVMASPQPRLRTMYGLLPEVFESLELDRRLGVRAAKDLLQQPLVQSAMARLRTVDPLSVQQER